MVTQVVIIMHIYWSRNRSNISTYSWVIVTDQEIDHIYASRAEGRPLYLGVCRDYTEVLRSAKSAK